MSRPLTAPRRRRPPVTAPPPVIAARPVLVATEVPRPRVVFGVVWVAGTAASGAAGPGWLALWLTGVAVVATAQAMASWPRDNRPRVGPAAMVAAAWPLGASAGADGLALALAAAVIVVLAAGMATPPAHRLPAIAGAVLVGSVVGVASASLVLARGLGAAECLALLALATAYDIGAYLVGTGAASWWEGPAAGITSLVPITLVIASVLVHPFDGGSPWLMAALFAVCAPLGPLIAATIVGGERAAPTLGRLDSLVVAGPVWAWCAAVLL